MKQKIVFILRKLRLLVFTDYIKFLFSFIRNLKDNYAFIKKNPDIKIPPPYILFESFGKLNYNDYYFSGKESAKYIIGLFRKYSTLTNAKICEWGCGPARLIRHFGAILNDSSINIYGTDYNKKTIEWCKKNIPDVTFQENNLRPPLNFLDNTFDFLYCISVFTHLSKELQLEWLEECFRVLRSDGIFLMSVHGDSCSNNLLDNEKKEYLSHGCVVRSNVKEGQRTFTAYNSSSYMRNIFLKDKVILEFIEGIGRKTQDIWIIKK